VSIAIATAAMAVLAAGPARAQQPARACTPAELAGRGQLTVTPFLVRGSKLEPEDPPLRSRSRYQLSVNTPLGVRDETVQITGPPALGIARVAPDQAEFTLTTGDPGTLNLTTTWQQDTGNGDETCAASAPLNLSVVDPRPPRLTVRRFAVGVVLVVKTPRSPIDERPVTYEVRLRRGKAIPPSLAVRPFFKLTPRYLAPPQSVTRNVFGGATVEVVGQSRGLLRPPRPFGISILLRQGGRVVGGLRAGLVCRFALVGRGRARYFALRCRAVRLAARP
jgi:hypothetical protein